MKHILKKYWLILVFALIINVPIFIVGVTTTNEEIILKGDTVPFTSVVEVDTDYEEKGSFSTIYVVSMYKSTILQNLFSDLTPTTERYTISTYFSHITNEENYRGSKIDYNASIQKALILAYNEAKKIDSNINIEYKLKSYDVTYYGADSLFRIGDKIIGVNGISINDEDAFREEMNKQRHVGDTFDVIPYESGIATQYVLESVNSGFIATDVYEINMETISPKVNINNTNVGGPSGGLLQTLSIYNRLLPEDLTHGLKIAGTGTISYDGKVGLIGGIKEKIPTAIDDGIDVFFCASGNYEDALKSYNSLPNRSSMKLIKIETFYDALNYLLEGYKNDF